MLDIYNFSEPKLLAFILVLIRMIAFMVVWPVFGSVSVPVQAKILFSLVLSVVIFPIVGWEQISNIVIGNNIIWLAGREVFVGLSIAYLGRLFFFAIGGAGHLIGISIGYGAAQVYNPTFNEQTNVADQFYLIMTTLVFLSLNGHHLLLSGLVQSYDIVPLSEVGIQLEAFKNIAALGQDILLISVKVAAPVLVAILLTNVAMGIVGRAVPQINVLITSLSVNILVGLLIMLVCVPMFVEEMPKFLNEMTLNFFRVMKTF